MAEEKQVTIYFLDGSEMSLSFPDQGGNPLLLAKRVQQAMEANYAAFEIDGKLTVIPKTGIKYLQMASMPAEVPETVIRGARLCDSD